MHIYWGILSTFARDSGEPVARDGPKGVHSANDIGIAGWKKLLPNNQKDIETTSPICSVNSCDSDFAIIRMEFFELIGNFRLIRVVWMRNCLNLTSRIEQLEIQL